MVYTCNFEYRPVCTHIHTAYQSMCTYEMLKTLATCYITQRQIETEGHHDIIYKHRLDCAF